MKKHKIKYTSCPKCESTVKVSSDWVACTILFVILLSAGEFFILIPIISGMIDKEGIGAKLAVATFGLIGLCLIIYAMSIWWVFGKNKQGKCRTCFSHVNTVNKKIESGKRDWVTTLEKEGNTLSPEEVTIYKEYQIFRNNNQLIDPEITHSWMQKNRIYNLFIKGVLFGAGPLGWAYYYIINAQSIDKMKTKIEQFNLQAITLLSDGKEYEALMWILAIENNIAPKYIEKEVYDTKTKIISILKEKSTCLN